MSITRDYSLQELLGTKCLERKLAPQCLFFLNLFCCSCKIEKEEEKEKRKKQLPLTKDLFGKILLFFF